MDRAQYKTEHFSRMGRLTAWQVVDAFPEECKTILPREIRKHKKILKPYFDLIEEIKEDFIDDFKRWFWVEAVKVMMPKETKFNYDFMLRIKEIYKNNIKMEKEGKEKIDINKAKNVLIESLYSFEKLKKTRKNIIACCPFHREKTPSFYIYKETNSFYCFGCHVGGDVIEFIMKLNNINFVEAVKFLGG